MEDKEGNDVRFWSVEEGLGVGLQTFWETIEDFLDGG